MFWDWGKADNTFKSAHIIHEVDLAYTNKVMQYGYVFAWW